MCIRLCRLSGVLVFCCVLLLGSTESRAEDNTFDAKLAAELGADEYGMRSYVFCVLKTGPAEITDEAKRNEIFRGHFANMSRLAEQGMLVLAGPLIDAKPNRGIYIFKVATIEEAVELVKSDPAVQAGIFEYELSQLYCSAALLEINAIHSKIQKTTVE